MAEVENLQRLLHQLKAAEKDIRLGARKEIRQAAEPVRGTAEGYAVERIAAIGQQWSRMRVGIAKSGVYVAPRKRGRKAGPGKRPNLAGLLMTRAMQPALDRHQNTVVRDVEQAIDREAARFNRSV